MPVEDHDDVLDEVVVSMTPSTARAGDTHSSNTSAVAHSAALWTSHESEEAQDAPSRLVGMGTSNIMPWLTTSSRKPIRLRKIQPAMNAEVSPTADPVH